MKEWDYVYVSDTSEKDALEKKHKRIIIKKCNDWYVCVANDWEVEYLKWDVFSTLYYKYAVPVPKTKTITLEVTEEQEKEINNILNKVYMIWKI